MHELAHILQRERGELEEIKKLVKLNPEEQLNHKIEIEADDIAYHYMSQQNDVSKAIAKYLIGLRRNKFDNFDSTELLLMKGDINKLLNKNVFNDC